MPKVVASLEKKVQRGPESWNHIYVTLGFALTIEGVLVSIIDPIHWWGKLVLSILVFWATGRLFLTSAWFQNKLIGWKRQIEGAFRPI